MSILAKLANKKAQLVLSTGETVVVQLPSLPIEPGVWSVSVEDLVQPVFIAEAHVVTAMETN